ncbi:hypothetical protein [Pandoraea sp.]|uniref:hypothetical protein n=1 Tax=Pandoraea sp. TaxID=1883445 RepID=UPI001D938270|nr:hypothetical protein [Pandoraea sp.]MBU6494631.1 hypothetical protein [Burkholderiales bacterium]MDE2287045.1 hypothetical protein [Burkholderiales bacterium]MDE2611185.1 hypothetical protein [Burkholderiales bacterium]
MKISRHLGVAMTLAAVLCSAGGAAMARTHVGVFIGPPIYSYPYPYPYYPYAPAPYYYAPPVMVAPPSPPVYIQQEPTDTQDQGGNWYYCRSSRAYYPYVKTCPEGWQTVPARPR